MSTNLLFAFGAVIFICTSLGALMYGYTVLRRNYTIALANVGEAPALYVRPVEAPTPLGAVSQPAAKLSGLL